jgi:hypothetical protein
MHARATARHIKLRSRRCLGRHNFRRAYRREKFKAGRWRAVGRTAPYGCGTLAEVTTLAEGRTIRDFTAEEKQRYLG